MLWENSLRHSGCTRKTVGPTWSYPGGQALRDLTGLCDSDCAFCVRKRQDGIGGYFLRHPEELSRDRCWRP